MYTEYFMLNDTLNVLEGYLFLVSIVWIAAIDNVLFEAAAGPTLGIL